jgi:hypothetical protein
MRSSSTAFGPEGLERDLAPREPIQKFGFFRRLPFAWSRIRVVPEGADTFAECNGHYTRIQAPCGKFEGALDDGMDFLASGAIYQETTDESIARPGRDSSKAEWPLSVRTDPFQ